MKGRTGDPRWVENEIEIKCDTSRRLIKNYDDDDDDDGASDVDKDHNFVIKFVVVKSRITEPRHQGPRGNLSEKRSRGRKPCFRFEKEDSTSFLEENCSFDFIIIAHCWFATVCVVA